MFLRSRHVEVRLSFQNNFPSFPDKLFGKCNHTLGIQIYPRAIAQYQVILPPRGNNDFIHDLLLFCPLFLTILYTGRITYNHDSTRLQILTRFLITQFNLPTIIQHQQSLRLPRPNHGLGNFTNSNLFLFIHPNTNTHNA